MRDPSHPLDQGSDVPDDRRACKCRCGRCGTLIRVASSNFDLDVWALGAARYGFVVDGRGSLGPGLQLVYVEAVHSVTGAYDMIVRLASEHIDGIEKARAEIAGLPGVAEVTTHVVLERFAG